MLSRFPKAVLTAPAFGQVSRRWATAPIKVVVEGSNGINGASIPVLKDTFGRKHNYLRISLTERCNLRCQYCMPAEGIELTPDEKVMTAGEIIRISKVFCTMGVTKIRLTGGEPLVRKDFSDIATELGGLRKMGLKDLCITTNGITLSRKLPVLLDAGFTKINISLDTLQEPKYSIITRRLGHEKVLRAINDCLEAGLMPKINCVVVRGVNDDEIEAFVELTRDKAVQVRFIEYMPFGGNRWKKDALVPWMELWDRIEAKFGTLTPLQGSRNETSKNFTLEGHKGSIGFITTMTSQFCGTCNRIRLTADGQLKVCLFDTKEMSLLELMRGGATDEELMHRIAEILLMKKAALGGHESSLAMAKHADANRPMIKIGG